MKVIKNFSTQLSEMHRVGKVKSIYSGNIGNLSGRPRKIAEMLEHESVDMLRAGSQI